MKQKFLTFIWLDSLSKDHSYDIFGLNTSTRASRSAMAPVKSCLALNIFVVSNLAVQGTFCQCDNICFGEVWAGTTSQVLGEGANMNNEATGCSVMGIPSMLARIDTAAGTVTFSAYYQLHLFS